MKKMYDEVLGCEVEVQEVITPEIEKEMRIEDPEEIKNVIEKGVQ